MEKSESEYVRAKASVAEPPNPLTDPNPTLVKTLNYLKWLKF